MTNPRQRLSSMEKVRWRGEQDQTWQTPERSPTFKNNGAVRPKPTTKPKPFYERKTKTPTVGTLQGLPLVSSETAQNLVRKESWRRVASLPPPGSSLDENMLSQSGVPWWMDAMSPYPGTAYSRGEHPADEELGSFVVKSLLRPRHRDGLPGR